MFNKQSNEEKKPQNAETVIGPSVKVKGNFHGDGNMIIEGIFEGSIKTNNKLYVGNKAKITASVRAKDARIGGEINGNVKIDGYLEITSSAKITGDIEASALSIERGAQFNGKCSMGNDHKGHEHKRHDGVRQD